MTGSFWFAPAVGAYALLFGVAAVGLFLWQVKRKGRPGSGRIQIAARPRRNHPAAHGEIR